LDSALSLEYGDDHLHNEFGEVTSRWDDAKIEAAAREYFSKEEKEYQEALRQKEKKSPNRRSDIKSGRSRNRNRRGGSIAKSQASSILSSSSEHSFVSYASSSSGSRDGLEMEAAMMDLELAKRSIAEKVIIPSSSKLRSQTGFAIKRPRKDPVHVKIVTNGYCVLVQEAKLLANLSDQNTISLIGASNDLYSKIFSPVPDQVQYSFDEMFNTWKDLDEIARTTFPAEEKVVESSLKQHLNSRIGVGYDLASALKCLHSKR